MKTKIRYYRYIIFGLVVIPLLPILITAISYFKLRNETLQKYRNNEICIYSYPCWYGVGKSTLNQFIKWDLRNFKLEEGILSKKSLDIISAKAKKFRSIIFVTDSLRRDSIFLHSTKKYDLAVSKDIEIYPSSFSYEELKSTKNKGPYLPIMDRQ